MTEQARIERNDRRRARKALAEHMAAENHRLASLARAKPPQRQARISRKRHKAALRLWREFGSMKRTARRLRRAEWAAAGHSRPVWRPLVKIPSMPSRLFEQLKRMARGKSAAAGKLAVGGPGWRRFA